MASKYAGIVQDELRDLRGNAMQGAVVIVRQVGTTTPATVYNNPVLIASAGGGDALINDAVTGLPAAAGLLLPGVDANGNYTFYADADLSYDLRVVWQGNTFDYRVRPKVVDEAYTSTADLTAALNGTYAGTQTPGTPATALDTSSTAQTKAGGLKLTGSTGIRVKNDPYMDVREQPSYVAGAADNSAAVQSAIDNAPARMGKILMPDGLKIAQKVTVPHAGLSIEGPSDITSAVRWTGAAGGIMFEVVGPNISAQPYGTGFKNLHIQGEPDSSGGANRAKTAIAFRHGFDQFLENVWIENFSGGASLVFGHDPGETTPLVSTIQRFTSRQLTIIPHGAASTYGIYIDEPASELFHLTQTLLTFGGGTNKVDHSIWIKRGNTAWDGLTTDFDAADDYSVLLEVGSFEVDHWVSEDAMPFKSTTLGHRLPIIIHGADFRSCSPAPGMYALDISGGGANEPVEVFATIRSKVSATVAPNVRFHNCAPIYAIEFHTDSGLNGAVERTATATKGTNLVDSRPVTQAFTADGTATKPVGNYSAVDLTAVAGGGGGGAGRLGAAGTARTGGGGGGGGGAVMRAGFPYAMVPSAQAVVVGAGGAGGAAVSTNDTNGNNGSGGGNSSWGSIGAGGLSVRATGGNGGGGGQSGVAGSAGSSGILGGAGGASSATGALGTAGQGGSGAAAGGGAGGGITTGDVASAGATGGTAAVTGRTGGSAGAVGVAGSAPAAVAAAGEPSVGSGGGGGGAATSGAAGAGGAGGNYGGGGGGGGAGTNGGSSGAGGAGAPGIVYVVYS